MKFGSVDNIDDVDFSLPPDHPDTEKLLKRREGSHALKTYFGFGFWSRKDLKDFYPRGIKDELQYYSTQFNSIELNATFYQPYLYEQFQKWKAKTPEDFKFFPKINQTISHLKRLNDVKDQTKKWVKESKGLEEKLHTIALQLHENFGPKYFDRIERFVNEFPQETPLAIEVRSQEWFKDKIAKENLYQLFESKRITNILFDTAGRRDLLHMRLTTPTAYIRFVGYGEESDLKRLMDWVERIKVWKQLGLQELYIFIGSSESINPIGFARKCVEILNQELSLDIHIPLMNEPSNS